MLVNGPWFIAQTLLLLTKGEPGFEMEKLSSKTISIWVKLRRVLLELFTSVGLSHITSAIGCLCAWIKPHNCGVILVLLRFV